MRREPYGLELLRAELEADPSQHHQIAPMFLIVRQDAIDANLASALRRAVR
jgi:hypothetical protein